MPIVRAGVRVGAAYEPQPVGYRAEPRYFGLQGAGLCGEQLSVVLFKRGQPSDHSLQFRIIQERRGRAVVCGFPGSGGMNGPLELLPGHGQFTELPPIAGANGVGLLCG